MTATGLTSHGRAQSSRFVLPMRQAELPSVAAEAEIYLLVNGAGTLQSADDLTRAQHIAETSQQVQGDPTHVRAADR